MFVMIFDERIENAKRILARNELSDKHPVADAAYIIRYLRYIGEDERKILKIIERLFVNKYYVPSRPDMSRYYKPAYAMSKRLPPIRTDSINITESQIKLISSIGDIDAEHFIFASLCIYKYYKQEDKLYTVKLKDALKLACISNVKKIAWVLRDGSLVRLKQFHNVHYVEIDEKLLQNDYKIAVSIDNFINICYYYDNLIGNGKFTYCSRCGCIVKQPSRGRPRIYCKDCYKVVNLEQRKEWQRRNQN